MTDKNSALKLPWSPLSFSCQMLYSPGGERKRGGGGLSLQGKQPAAAHTVSVPSCPRTPEFTDHLYGSPGESQPGGGRAADLGGRSDRGPVCVHPRSNSLSFPSRCSGSSAVHPGGCSRPTADSRVPPAGSTGCEHTLQLHEAGKLCQTCPQPMSLHVCFTANRIL